MRMWEIREGYGRKEKDELEEAYEQGCKDGYEKAMEEMNHRGSYGQRGDYGERGNSYGNRQGMRDGYHDYSEMGERRRRDSMGRYM